MSNDNWIEEVLSEVSHVETPHNWLWWSLISAISAAAGPNFYVRALKGTFTYKPNLYVILLGESGLGKGFGINLSKLLVQKADCTRVIAGRSSIQSIVTELSVQRTRPDGKPPVPDSRAFIINGELQSALVSDTQALGILTDLYDGNYNDEWVNMLKLSGKEKLSKPHITALFGTAPAGFYEMIPQANIDGGYIGRNLIIYEEKRSKDVDLLEDDDTIDDRLTEHIIPYYAKHLELLSKNKARLIHEPLAKDLYNTWRRKWRTNQKPDKTGFLNRVPDHVMKVSMLLCLSRYSSGGVIKISDVETAIEKVTDLIYANKMSTEGRGIDPTAGQSKLFLDILIRSKDNQATRKKVLNDAHGNFNAYDLDKMLTTMIEMGYVEKERITVNYGTGHDDLYKLAGEPLQNYLKWKERNQK